MREGRWRTWEPAAGLGADLAGATLGIVGRGRIGDAVARRAEGFGMDVLASSRRSGVPLEELLERADFVSLHCPLTPATRHLIGTEALARMKPTAYLVNTARGGVVDQTALRLALLAGEIAGAALDVTDPEPLPADDPLLEAPNLLVVPHVGSATVRTRERMAEMAVENLLAALAGRADALPRLTVRVAVVDIGTNSTRLLVADVGADGGGGARPPLGRHPPRRGRRRDRPRSATRRSERVLDTLAGYAESIERHGCERRIAVMTSAVRDAANGAEFADDACATASGSTRARSAATRRRG